MTISKTEKMIAEKDGAIGWVTFNNPARRNAVSMAMWEALSAAMPLVDSAVEDEVCHPDSLLAKAVHVVEQARAAEERALAERWATDGVSPLCVDGSIATLGDCVNSSWPFWRFHKISSVRCPFIPRLMARRGSKCRCHTAWLGAYLPSFMSPTVCVMESPMSARS